MANSVGRGSFHCCNRRAHGALSRQPSAGGATTLIVSLGLLSKPLDLLIIEIAVLLLTLQALIINRLAGLPYPLWENRPIDDLLASEDQLKSKLNLAGRVRAANGAETGGGDIRIRRHEVGVIEDVEKLRAELQRAALP